MDSPPPDSVSLFIVFNLLFQAEFIQFAGIYVFWFAVLIILLGLSSLFSAAENSFFSLSKTDLEEIKNTKDEKKYQRIQGLLSSPKLLLATILIGNNLVNVGFIIISTYLIGDSLPPIPKFLIGVLGVTFFLLLFGEIIPKTYATRFNIKTACFLSTPIQLFQKTFLFLILPLSKSVGWLDKKIKHKEEKLSAVQLNQAIDIASGDHTNKEEKAILKGIINFGNTEVKQIMKPRMDVVAVDIDSNFKELLYIVRENGYSRMPVYKENFDHTEGVLYIKDILPFLEEEENYNWKRLIKPPFFVPETKKIDDLLKEFQEKRVHFAVVVDEYGGKSGIVTLEDILEEIFGEINDEFDVDTILYTKINDNTYSVDAKMLIIDFCKLVEVEEDYFDNIKGDSETLGGLVLELAGKIPNKNQKLNFEDFEFTVEAADKRRIKNLKIEKKSL